MSNFTPVKLSILNGGWVGGVWGVSWLFSIKAVSRFAPSQWETALLCNDVSHWLCASLESALSITPNIMEYKLCAICLSPPMLCKVCLISLDLDSPEEHVFWSMKTMKVTWLRQLALQRHMQHLQLLYVLTHLPCTKWPPFRRRYFKMHFHEWKVLYSDSNFTFLFLRVQLTITQHWFK